MIYTLIVLTSISFYIEYFFFVAFCTLFYSRQYISVLTFYAVVNLLLPTTVGCFKSSNEPFGGLKWTRTIDLTLIRRVL